MNVFQGFSARRIFICLSLFSVSSSVWAQQDSLMNILQAELTRSMQELKKATIPAYYIDYRVHDIQYAHLQASFGSLTQSVANKNRVLMTRVKVGDYKFDNTHPMSLREMNYMPGSGGSGRAMLPYENDALAIKYGVWTATQGEYKQALETYKSVKASSERVGAQPSVIPDFSNEQPASYYEPPLPDFSSTVNLTVWQEKIKKYSALFLQNKDLVTADVNLSITAERKYFLSTENTKIVQNSTAVYMNIAASIRATDGDIVPLHISYYAAMPEGLPGDEKIMEDVKKMIATLAKLQNAPLAEPYSGPAILVAQTAGVFFHEIFGHRIEGHRLKNEEDGQTFKAKVGELVLPKTLNVYFDPTLHAIAGKSVNGWFQYDDEGIKSQRVNVVEKGILKNFLMSRTPLENFAHSNGHGRASVGADPVSRQSNLVVETDKPVSMTDLRKMLIKECNKQGKAYGYLFKDVVGGFTVTDRYNPNAFNIFPTEVYRIYTDGRPDELVRGVDLIGTPLAMFAEIQAAANDRDVFIGFCGAESGSVPVSASSPSLFVRRIETQKKPKEHLETMLLERPGSVNP
ncbi:metallopeptidase TldD-related protein [Ohtaekwangia koreensis]|uniref:metallopeptidase TldD-related protein n=1 Tax=Ohtaekwangia koreensis TaxID=688867 RepID=UPI00117CA2BA|nr:metallopeptidase TldD-related protein [Ohtaekwangia koreensis]